jgi:predicted enzyme related to lactoylglutathione lyase
VTSLHTILYVADQASARSFWRQVLDREPTLDVPGMTEFAVGDGVLGLMPEAGIHRLLGVVPGPGARVELYLRVDDPGAHHARAVSAGAVELSPPSVRGWGDLVAYCLAPDGVVLAFARAQG